VRKLDHRKLYRLPWSLTDNVISWLEPTKQCNIYCEGCYSANAAGSHKSLEAIRQDLDVFTRYRKTDAISIAGGEPLVYPEIVEVVRMIAERGFKPVINSNGKALTPELLRELKKAGLHGFTFHIDSLQKRDGWTGKDEIEL
jgi:MoaA/NifB/PqqE/SkfB family radical SAM enzyme